MNEDMGEVTRLLVRVRQGQPGASDELFTRVHVELRRLAAGYMRNERREHTLQPTALVHEAYLRLVDQREVSPENRAHFFGIAAGVMRRILIDHARARNADKRGGDHVKVELDDAAGVAAPPSASLIELDRALERLTAIDPRRARVVELRFFGGLTVEEIAEILAVGPRTVDRDWRVARAWLRRELDSAS
jgi:RNA polymerase sigma-70 factor (ECF subfamily)